MATAAFIDVESRWDPGRLGKKMTSYVYGADVASHRKAASQIASIMKQDPHTLSDPETWPDQYGDVLYRYAYFRLNKDSATAEDIVQETFLAGLKAKDRFSGRSSERTWLVGILKHKLIDHIRRNREILTDTIEETSDRHPPDFDEKGHWLSSVKDWRDPSHSLENQQFWEVFSDCITKLPANLADAYLLREINLLSSEEICQALQVSSHNNLWVILSRARKKIRACLEAHWFG